MDETRLRINAERLREGFEALSQIGTTGDGGVNRPSLGEAHLAARAWFGDRVRSAGLGFQVDTAGNHSACLPSRLTHAQTLLLGSHLDSVPDGGCYDGALGVLAALEVLRVVNESGAKLPVNLEAIDFTDEEGTLVGELGSAALAGKLTMESLRSPRGGRPALEAGLARAGLTEAGLLTAGRQPGSLVGYLELHIEQGKRLVQVGADIGVVTSIVGICSYRVSFIGQADHAGTTGLADRRDALRVASGFMLALWETLERDFPGCVANIGAVHVSPGVFNIVPARADLSLEFRAPDLATLNRLEATLVERVRIEAERYDLSFEDVRLDRVEPAQMDGAIQEAIVDACLGLGLQPLHLASYAGHDAQALAGFCPAGMIFIPSVDGASHSRREFSEWKDCVNGANTLLQAVLRVISHYEGLRAEIKPERSRSAGISSGN